MNRAGSLFRLGRLPEARADYDRAVELLRPRGQARILATTLVARGTLHATLKEFEAAEADFDEALDVFRRAGIPREVATCLLGKADALLKQDRPGDAVAAYEQIDVALLSQDERYMYHHGHARALKKAGRERRCPAAIRPGPACLPPLAAR